MPVSESDNTKFPVVGKEASAPQCRPIPIPKGVIRIELGDPDATKEPSEEPPKEDK